MTHELLKGNILTFVSMQFEGLIGNIMYFLLFIVFLFIYPRLLISQMLWKLEQTARELEGMTSSAKKIVTRKVSNNPSRELKDAVSNFLEFFIIEPVNLDPYGIVKKIEHVVDQSEEKFKYFVKKIAPKFDSEAQADLTMGLSGAISLNQISKIVRHYVEMVKKMKNLQYGLIIQMQLPLIERISKALLKGTEALTNGWPIGDSIGPYIAAGMIDKGLREVEEDIVASKKRIKNRDVIIMKAKGPGGRTGKLGKAVEKIVKKQKISKIITIDAAAKLEGERTGSVAEGVGVAIGGIGVDRVYIENIATQKDIPLDSFLIKMSAEEAIMPMRLEILNATPKVVKAVEENIAESSRGGKIIVVGVGNTSGVGNDKKSAKEAELTIKKIIHKVNIQEKEEEKKNKKGIGWFGSQFGI